MKLRKNGTLRENRPRFEDLEARLLLNADLNDPTEVEVVAAEVSEPVTEGDEADSEFGDPRILFAYLPIESNVCVVGRDQPIEGNEGDSHELVVYARPTDDDSSDNEGETITGDEESGDFGKESDSNGETEPDFEFDPIDVCPMYRGDVIYTLSGAAEGERNPYQGADEVEPNDSIETATAIDLRVFPTFAPGLNLSGANLVGVAGGEAQDQDYFAFETQQGYHVSVNARSLVMEDGQAFESIDDWIQAHGFNEYGDPIDTMYLGGTPLFNEATGESIDRLAYILANHPELTVQDAEVIVYDAAGNELARTGSDPLNAATASFDAPEDGVYYAMVSIPDSGAGVDLTQYRLSILAQSEWDDDWILYTTAGNGEAPKVVTLRAGESFGFRDSDGDAINVSFDGRGGSATITFTGSSAKGSDIASVVVHSKRRGGSLTVQASGHGSAEVGSVEIQVQAGRSNRAARRASPGNGFGRIKIDGNLGSFTSNVNVRGLVVDGILGEVNAANSTLGRLSADAFDLTQADCAGIDEVDVTDTDPMEILGKLAPIDMIVGADDTRLAQDHDPNVTDPNDVALPDDDSEVTPLPHPESDAIEPGNADLVVT